MIRSPRILLLNGRFPAARARAARVGGRPGHRLAGPPRGPEHRPPRPLLFHLAVLLRKAVSMGYERDPGSYGYPPYGPPRRRYRRHAISHGTVAILAAVAAVLITLQVTSSGTGTGTGNLPGSGAVPGPAAPSTPAGAAGTAAIRQAVNKV